MISGARRRVTLDLPWEVVLAVDAIAAHRGNSRTYEVSRLLSVALAAEPPPPLPRKRPKARASHPWKSFGTLKKEEG